MRMRICIVDQCSGTKAVPDNVERFDEGVLARWSRDELLDRPNVPAVPAGQLYDGRQQRLISEATRMLRAGGDSVDRVFISAGFGVVDEGTELPPYDVTFSGRSTESIVQRAETLSIQRDLRQYIESGGPYEVMFFALGTEYYRSFDLQELMDAVPDTTAIILFNREGDADAHENVRSISARIGEAKEHQTAVIGLKGRYLRNFAEHRQRGASVSSEADVVSYCERGGTQQTGFEEYQS